MQVAGGERQITADQAAESARLFEELRGITEAIQAHPWLAGLRGEERYKADQAAGQAAKS